MDNYLEVSGDDFKSSGEKNYLEKGSKQFSQLPDSKAYIHKLEAKLSKVKGCNKELNSKDMISVMKNARDDHMCHLFSLSTNNLSIVDIDGDKEVSTSYIERKLFPEKSGVTYEELQHLLTSDVLAKVISGEDTLETTNENGVDR